MKGTRNVVGIDPHRKTFTAGVLDERGGELGGEHFANTTEGYRAAIEWAIALGPIDRWGVENASSLGRHLAEFLVAQGFDVSDVPPHRSAERGRGRHQGKATNSTLTESPRRPRTIPASRAPSRTINPNLQIPSGSKLPCGTTPAAP